MFVEAIRRYLGDAAARPDRLARGTARSGRRPGAVGAAWRSRARRGRSNGLAQLVGLSRSVFAERFTEMVGQPPMQYLALWRMQLASRLLIDGGQVAAVAGAVGYESEAAFSRAFKKLVGQAPATWRRGSVPAAAVSAPASASASSVVAPATPLAPLAHPARVSVAGARCKP